MAHEQIEQQREQQDGYWRIVMRWPIEGRELDDLEEEEWSVLKFSQVGTIIQKMTGYVECEIRYIAFTDPERV